MNNNAELYIAPGLPPDLTQGFTGPAGVTPPLTQAQATRVRRYGSRALWMGAGATGVIAVGVLIVIKIGRNVLGMDD